MTACFWALYYNKISGSPVAMSPHFQYELSCSSGRNYGSNFNRAFSYKLRKIHWKSGATDDNICACIYSLLHMFFVMLQCNHNIHTNKTVTFCNFFGTGNVFSYSDSITFSLIMLESIFIITNLCGRDDSYTPFSGHCSGKVAAAHANPHSTLYNWFLSDQFSNLKCM